jgi:hypothetical protein
MQPLAAMMQPATLAHDLLGGDVWLASAGHVELDGPRAPSGRVEGLVTPVRRRARRAAKPPAKRAARTRTSRGLPPAAVRRVAVVGPAASRTGDAPPLTALGLPAGVVPDWGVPAPVVLPAAEEPVALPLPPPPALPHRRVVRRVGLGAPLPVPPPRGRGFEPETFAAPPQPAPAAPKAPDEAQPLRAFPRRRLESVPDEIRRAVEAATGVVLGDVSVRRDEQTTQIARALGAKAFTVGGEVHLPAEHGPLTDPRTRALLAHELVHVAQQRRLGDALPPEDSPYGRLLEEEALALERTWVAPEPLDAVSAVFAGVQRRPVDDAHDVEARVPPTLDELLAALDLDELAGRLYGRVRERLRHELLVDRERSARLTDGL